MGIRINVCLGWGFTDVEENDQRFTDEFLKLWRSGEDLLEQFKKAIVAAKEDGYNREAVDAALLLQRINGMGWFDRIKAIRHLDVGDIVYQSGYAYEGDTESPMIFVPIEQTDWHRHDDIIDYYKAGRTPEDVIEIIKDDADFPCPIYPYACYVNRRNGKLIPNGGTLAMFRRGYGSGSLPTLSEIVSKDMMTKLMDVGITTTEQLHDDMVPEPPYSIRLFCETFSVFKDKFEVYNLVPMIYTYWC